MQNLKNNLILLKNLGLLKGARAIFAKKHLASERLNSNTKNTIAQQLGITKEVNRAKTAVFARYATSFAILGVFFIAQWAVPGQTLYSIKKKAEDARALVQPGFKEELKVIRESQSNTNINDDSADIPNATNGTTDESEKSGNDDNSGSRNSGSGSSGPSGDGIDDTIDDSGSESSDRKSGSGSSGSGNSGSGSDGDGDSGGHGSDDN